MSNFKKEYELWVEFLKVWPLARLASMTLEDYTQAGSKDSFTYWIESRLDELGSIWGGSSFKFGVFSRKDTDDKTSDAKLSYSDMHGWYSSLGASADEAFKKVREHVAQVAKLAEQGDLDGIENFDHLDEAYKWKIAFHYQDRKSPVIVGIFKKAPLEIFVGDTAAHSMAALQKAAVAKRPAELGILEFGRQMWEAWCLKNLAIWKLSHGNPNFTDAERQQYLDGQWAVMPRDTEKEQGKKFAEAPVGTLFFLFHDYKPQRIGKFTSDAAPCDKGDGWLQRSYQVLKPALRTDRYIASPQSYPKYWSPQGNSTFGQFDAHDLPDFEITLLKPYFGIDLAELAGLADEKTPAIKPIGTALNRIYYGPPGTGKTYTLTRLLKKDYEQDAGVVQRYSFVTFHQSYGYEEFVEGLRPVLKGDAEAGEIQYEIRPGVFKELCSKARLEPDQRFAMVIDEINRGNISKIFGELITLIEADKREGAANMVSVTLSYSGESFSVPANVDIIGTMNTADRSLALLDTALRRRFEFKPVLPDARDEEGAPLHSLRVTSGEKVIDIPKMLSAINQRVEALYDRDHCIGHAYFTALAQVPDGDKRFDDLTQVFRNRIVPLLEEYFFEDWQKIRLVLGDNQKDKDMHFIQDHEQALDRLFGSDHGLDAYDTKRRYTLQETAFSKPDAYIGIYQTLIS